LLDHGGYSSYFKGVKACVLKIGLVLMLIGLSGCSSLSIGQSETVAHPLLTHSNVEVLGLVSIVFNRQGQVVEDDNLGKVDEDITGRSHRELLLNKARLTMPTAQDVIDIKRNSLIVHGLSLSSGGKYTVYTGLAVVYK
jgi:hypothetical protein